MNRLWNWLIDRLVWDAIKKWARISNPFGVDTIKIDWRKPFTPSFVRTIPFVQALPRIDKDS